MKITKIGLNRSIKLSINYQSIQAGVSLEAEVEDGETVESVRRQLSEMLNEIIQEELESQMHLLTTNTGGTK